MLFRSRCQVAPRAVDILQLAGPDLGYAAARGEYRVGREEIVDFLEYALWLDGHAIVIGLAGQLSMQLRLGVRQYGPEVEVVHIVDLLDRAYGAELAGGRN